MRGLRTAVTTLTGLSWLGRGGDFAPGQALPWFPLVGALIGGSGALLLSLWGRWQPDGSGSGAFFAVLLHLLLTRGLHLDGLADWGDALGARGDRERMLRIMKEPQLGTYGTLFLLMGVLGRWVALERICARQHLLWVVAAALLGRFAMSLLASSSVCARPGSGTGSPFIGPQNRPFFLPTALVGLMGMGALGGTMGLGLALGCLLLLGVMRWRFHVLLGGVTGDLLGATGEGVEVLVLWVGMLMRSDLLPWWIHG